MIEKIFNDREHIEEYNVKKSINNGRNDDLQINRITIGEIIDIKVLSEHVNKIKINFSNIEC